MDEPKRLYFGYGSNMWKDQMSSRCEGSKFMGIGVYPGWQVFKPVLTIDAC